MKRFFTCFTFLSLACLFPFLSRGQFSKGQKVLGGSLSVGTVAGSYIPTSTTVYHTNNTGIGISPSYARFKNERLLVGAAVSYSYYYNKRKPETSDVDGSISKANTFGLDVFSQRFIRLGNGFFFTIMNDASIFYKHQREDYLETKTSSNTKTYGASVSIAPGVSYQLNSRFLLDAHLSDLISASFYRSASKTPDAFGRQIKTGYNSFGLSSSLNNVSLGYVALGFRWLLKQK